jgi:hypothetical protein
MSFPRLPADPSGYAEHVLSGHARKDAFECLGSVTCACSGSF